MECVEICKPFDSLTNRELYAILRLRSEIFVVEQNCIFLDLDNVDQFCQHLMIMQNQELMAYARLVPPNLTFEYAAIGRVASSRSARGKGFGKRILQVSIENCIRLYGNHSIKIGAQLYLKNFYESFGFAVAGDVYDEDGIDHIQMIRPPK